MEQAKHTVGPWVVDEVGVYAQPLVRMGQFTDDKGVVHNIKHGLVALVYGGYEDAGDGNKASPCNRRLIAAAPELIELLGVYADEYNKAWQPGMPILEPEFDALMAKVRGE